MLSANEFEGDGAMKTKSKQASCTPEPDDVCGGKRTAPFKVKHSAVFFSRANRILGEQHAAASFAGSKKVRTNLGVGHPPTRGLLKAMERDAGEGRRHPFSQK